MFQINTPFPREYEESLNSCTTLYGTILLEKYQICEVNVNTWFGHHWSKVNLCLSAVIMI